MNIHDLIKSVIGEQVESVLAELTREESKQTIKSGKWTGEIFNPGGSGQPTSRIVYNIFEDGEKTVYEVYGNVDGWFLDTRTELYGPLDSPEKALEELEKVSNEKS